ncbi:MAG: Holliday junction resolvase RuvX [Caldilineaceae bacterium]
MTQHQVGKLLALDVGLRRIGVAVCDPLQLAARPLTVIERRSRNEDFELLAQLVKSEAIQAVICGLPLNMDGSEGERAASVRKWATRLAYALRALNHAVCPILFWDERLSTFAANEIRTQQWNEGRRTIVEEDAAAAAVILQSYLDAQREGDERDFGQVRLETMIKTGSAL